MNQGSIHTYVEEEEDMDHVEEEDMDQIWRRVRHMGLLDPFNIYVARSLIPLLSSPVGITLALVRIQYELIEGSMTDSIYMKKNHTLITLDDN